MWDIFSVDRSILFLVGDYNRTTPKIINTWDQQGMEQFMKLFAQVGPAQNGNQELNSQSQLKCLEMAIHKLTEKREQGRD